MRSNLKRCVMKKPYCMGLFALILLIVFVLFPGLGWTAMIKMSVEQLTEGADTIVLGSVISQESSWNDEHSAIYTDVTVAVEEIIKGSPGGVVTFRIAGGIVGEIGMRTSNDPVFKDGEEVIIFLSTNGTLSSVVGRSQGKYTVSSGKVTRDRITISVSDFTEAIRGGSKSE